MLFIFILISVILLFAFLIQNGFTIFKELLSLFCGYTPEEGDNDMVKHIFPVVPGLNHFAVLPKQVKECMKGPVDDLNVDVVPEYLLLNPGLY